MVGRVGFGVEDLFKGLIQQSSAPQISLPVANSQSPRPGEQFAARPGLLGGNWDVDVDNRFIDVFHGATTFIGIPWFSIR